MLLWEILWGFDVSAKDTFIYRMQNRIKNSSITGTATQPLSLCST